MQLKGKTALVTGGAGRIGHAIAQRLAQKGAKVAVHYYRQTEGPVGKNFFQADLSKPQAAQKLAAAVEENLGPIQVLINNAAVFEKTPFFETTEADWDRHLDINLKAPFFLAQAVAHSMSDKKSGKIINIADSAAFIPYRGYLAYSIAKAGLVALTMALARELAPHVQVNAIAPGPTLAPNRYSQTEIKVVANKTLLKRWGNPKEIANAVCFLIEGTDYATGSVLEIDGGRLLA